MTFYRPFHTNPNGSSLVSIASYNDLSKLLFFLSFFLLTNHSPNDFSFLSVLQCSEGNLLFYIQNLTISYSFYKCPKS